MTQLERETIKKVIENLAFYRDHGLAIMLNTRGRRLEPVANSVFELCEDSGNLAAASMDVLERLLSPVE